MTAKEVAQLVYVIKATYPKTYERFSNEDFANMIRSWQMVLEDYSYAQVSAGLKTYLASDTKGFPPTPGQVIDCIHRLHQAHKPEMTGMEAWSLVRKAIRNSTYNAEMEFERLPEVVQRAVGSPANLREMAALDIDRVETVEQSHFIRTYDAAVRRAAEDAKIPAKVREMIGQLDKPLLEGA